MKTTTSIFITAITVILTSSAMAENSLPPNGPYRSTNENNNSGLSQNSAASSKSDYENKHNAFQAEQLNKNFQNAEVPEWVKQRQTEMQNLVKQHNNRMQVERESQRFQQPEVPEWVKQRQTQMEQWQKQSNRLPTQSWKNQVLPQWGQNQPPPMRHPGSGQFAPNNNMYFPSARGPVFGPGVAPPGFNNQPGSRRPHIPAW